MRKAARGESGDPADLAAIDVTRALRPGASRPHPPLARRGFVDAGT
jgi:hypothetical protein